MISKDKSTLKYCHCYPANSTTSSINTTFLIHLNYAPTSSLYRLPLLLSRFLVYKVGSILAQSWLTWLFFPHDTPHPTSFSIQILHLLQGPTHIQSLWNLPHLPTTTFPLPKMPLCLPKADTPREPGLHKEITMSLQRKGEEVGSTLLKACAQVKYLKPVLLYLCFALKLHVQMIWRKMYPLGNELCKNFPL